MGGVMAKTVETAMTLMLMAAGLLDKAGERDGAVKLREAIDTVRCGPGLTAADPPMDYGDAPVARGGMLGRIVGWFRRE